MKTGLRVLLLLMTLCGLLAQQACTVKRDCRGHVKHRLPNGIWM